MSTQHPSSPPEPPDDEVLVDRALADLRRDLASVRAEPGLVDRVVARTRGGDLESVRFRRYARAYAAAAAVLLAAGVGGAYALRPAAADPRAALTDLETTQINLVRAASVADLAVGGR
jgi:hypothetical protein